MRIRIRRMALLVPALVASLSVASAAARVAPAAKPYRPSQLDYVVLASLADQPNMLALSRVRAPSIGRPAAATKSPVIRP